MAALWRMRARSMGGVADHAGKARWAQAMAESMAPREVVWIFARGLEVAGSMVWNDDVEEPRWSWPS